MTHYNTYVYKKRELLKYGAQALLIQGILSYLFYQSFFPLLLYPFFLWLFLERKERQLCRARKERLSLDFKDTIVALCAALKAGYSVENAVTEAYKDLLLLHGKENDMLKELLYIQAGLANNRTVEELFTGLGERSGVEDIQEFASVFQIAKRSGGDLNKILQNTAAIISDKIEVKREIKTIISAKQFEQQIMNVVPIVIILYISVSSPHFFDPLYHNVFGILMMSFCLVLYGLAFGLAEKITTIEV